ncbi:MAG: PAS domain-containing protein [Microthrixaceae bacterium]|nr:PAS domain-containing protein [Microthrixaceae bacterium]
MTTLEVIVFLAVVLVVIIPIAVAYLVGRSSAAGSSRDADVPTGSVTGSVPAAKNNTQLLGRLRDAFNHIDHAVVVADQDGNEVFVNSAAEKLRESRDGRVLVDSAANELLREALSGKVQSKEVDLFGPPARTFSISARPLSGSAGNGALVIVEDITMRRVTETVRRDFVANISHELKSPIGAMGLLADMIRQDNDPEVVTRLSNRMVHEAERASRTIDDLLELASIEFAGEADFAEVDAGSIVAEAVDRISSSADQAQVDIVTVDDFDGNIVCDRLQIISAIYNLIDNAIKYSPPGSMVEVSLRPSKYAGMIEFSVTDKGVGIPRRDLDRIFERFYRVDRARSRGTGGTGLGLAIVRHVANNHAGEVAVESIEGVGTTFTLTIATAPADSRITS